MKNYQNKKGFTLIELLVVVLIIGILSAVALPKYQTAVDKSRYTQLIAYVSAVKDAQERYYMENGEYTTDLENLDISLAGFSGSNGVYQKNNSRFILSFSHINDMASGGVVHIRDTRAEVSYFEYIDRHPTKAGRRECRAGTRTERAKKICLSLGGVFYKDNAENGTIYILP